MTPRGRNDVLTAMLSVSTSVASDRNIREILDSIARETVRSVGAIGATILLLSRTGRLRFGGSWGISDRYRGHLEGRISAPTTWQGPSGLALSRRRQVVIPHIQKNQELARWHSRASEEGYLSLTSTPLALGEELIGALNVHRGEVGPWPSEDLELLAFFADHAATALRISGLMDRQRRQIAEIDRVLRVLREQTHEHANRVHAIGALISMGEQNEAERFTDELLQMHGESRVSVISGIEPPALAGLLLAEINVSRQSGIQLTIHPDTHLTGLPRALSEVEWLALAGNLLEYAFEALPEVPPDRRRVWFEARNESDGVLLRVRDYGARSMPTSEPLEVDGVLFDPMISSHSLQSLAESLLIEAVKSAQATLTIEPQEVGTLTTVRVPT